MPSVQLENKRANWSASEHARALEEQLARMQKGLDENRRAEPESSGGEGLC
jgi:hypothetical protein